MAIDISSHCRKRVRRKNIIVIEEGNIVTVHELKRRIGGCANAAILFSQHKFDSAFVVRQAFQEASDVRLW